MSKRFSILAADDQNNRHYNVGLVDFTDAFVKQNKDKDITSLPVKQLEGVYPVKIKCTDFSVEGIDFDITGEKGVLNEGNPNHLILEHYDSFLTAKHELITALNVFINIVKVSPILYNKHHDNSVLNLHKLFIVVCPTHKRKLKLSVALNALEQLCEFYSQAIEWFKSYGITTLIDIEGKQNVNCNIRIHPYIGVVDETLLDDMIEVIGDSWNPSSIRRTAGSLVLHSRQYKLKGNANRDFIGIGGVHTVNINNSWILPSTLVLPPGVYDDEDLTSDVMLKRSVAATVLIAGSTDNGTMPIAYDRPLHSKNSIHYRKTSFYPGLINMANKFINASSYSKGEKPIGLFDITRVLYTTHGKSQDNKPKRVYLRS